MKRSSEAFKKLQRDWYEILKRSGFEDIENDDLSLVSKSGNHDVIFNEEEDDHYSNDIEAKSHELYYQRLSESINDPAVVFKNEAHWYIMTRHTEGAMIEEIVRELVALGMKRTRLSIRYIIRRYEMKWKIRFYTRKQLNLKN